GARMVVRREAPRAHPRVVKGPSQGSRSAHLGYSAPGMGFPPALLVMLVVGAGDAPGGAPAGPEVTPLNPPAAPSSDDLPMAIAWKAPDECPGLDELKAEIRTGAGRQRRNRTALS